MRSKRVIETDNSLSFGFWLFIFSRMLKITVAVLVTLSYYLVHDETLVFFFKFILMVWFYCLIDFDSKIFY